MSGWLTGWADGPVPVEKDVGVAGRLHDFNNAVQAISAGLHQLERRFIRGDADDLPAMTAAILEQVARIGSLGAGLACLASGEAPAEHPCIPVGPFIHALARQVATLLDGHTRLEVQVDADAGHVTCDPAQLESGVRNLVLNARDAMPDGGVLALRGHVVELGPGEDGAGIAPGRFAAITVADTGCGMGAEMLQRCFEPFVTTKSHSGGTGLGLFQLRVFATEMGGSVRLRSREGHGTEATILLPWTSSPASHPAQQAREQPP